MPRPIALVTGASRGIGRQTALVLAREGWDVAITARTVSEGTGTVPSRKTADGPVPVEGSLERSAALLEQEGARALPVAAQMMTGNYLHQLALIQVVLPAMLERGQGTIVNMASGSATTDPPAPPDAGGWSLAYAASKAAMGRIAGAITAEFGARGIRCFNVDPGFVITDAMRARGGAEEIEEQGFQADPEDAAGRVIAWLASDPSADPFPGKVLWSPKLAARL